MSPVERLARAHGIQLSYVAVTGEVRRASKETLARLLERFGMERVNDREARLLLGELNERAAHRVVEPVNVLWNGRNAGVRVRRTGRGGGMWVELEDGERSEVQATSRGSRGRGERVAIGSLPAGYHKLVVEDGEQRSESLLISAPQRVFSAPKEKREWGVFAPLYAVRSGKSWGAGNFSDWKQFTCWAAEQGAGVVASLPVLASFLGEAPFDPSPYAPASRLFWNEFFVDVEAAPEFAESRRARRMAGSVGFRRKLEEARGKDLIDYREEMGLRRKVLEVMAEEFFARGGSARRREYERFVKGRPELKEYARFRAAVEQKGRPWQNWEAQARHGVLRGEDYAAKTADYYSYCQWLAHEQVETVLAACGERGVKFYLDLPLGVHPESYDVWRYKDFFAQGVNAGAPPDAVFTKGQDWGFPPLHPGRMRELHYSHVIDFLRFQIQHTGMLRLDHVMGLHRLYWVPQGRAAAEGAYVTYPAEELYAILALESHRHQCVLVGENLGTVPKETERAMEAHRVRKMYVFQFETPGKKGLTGPKANEVASLGTHDMPMFAAHWKGKDIADRLKLGLLNRSKAKAEREARWKWREGVVRALQRGGFLGRGKTGPREVLKAMLSYLAQSEAPSVLVNVEDFWLEERPQNVPGTATERPNWRRKARLGLEEIIGSPRVAELCVTLRRNGN